METKLQYLGKKKTIVKDHTTEDIVREVLAAHKAFARDYDVIAEKFWRGNQLDTLQYIFNYCKRNFPYVVETEENQTTRSPGAIMKTARTMGVDCKHYAGWIAGILDALNRQGKNFSWKYRFASYDLFSSTPEHVFIVAKVAGKEYWIDPVLQYFDQRNPAYFYSFDKKPNMTIGEAPMRTLVNTSLQQQFLQPIQPTNPLTPTKPVIDRGTLSPTITSHLATGQTSNSKSIIPLLLIGAAVLYFATRK